MLASQTRLLLRLMPIASYFAQSPTHSNLSSLNFQFKNGFHSRCSTAIEGKAHESCKKMQAGCTSAPRKFLSSDNKDDYVLHQNSLTEAEKKEIESSVKKDFEDWVPFGFNMTDKEDDIFRYKMFLLTTLTFGVVVFIYVLVHLPPRNRREWITREAYLELERRQRLGLPLVDRDLIPADQVLLPSLDELGDDYDIII